MANLWSSVFADPIFNEVRDPLTRDPVIGRWLFAPTDDRALTTTTRGDAQNPNQLRAPRVDMTENDKAYVIKADLPGLQKGDVKIHVEDNMLTLEGERKNEREEKTDRGLIIERSFGHFRRSLRLPVDAEIEKCTARMENGVLQLELPKNPAREQRKQIDIQ
ncbi:hypothetical protein PhCBS80983_g00374 [Powellomyces hirtus]|uniref:SHSP domain-containing protein n=1 Tax=Powellomyces hirtus TaxID=109895 RepID=A0A507EFG3_9FUNG|nr:hypothetical protein PhCBS80983_g00374 [Powellomyces hirtus]